MAHVSESSAHCCLRTEAIERFNQGERRWPKREEFRKFFREVKGYRGPVERAWGRLVRGEPVPELVAIAFVEYLRERRKLEEATLDAYFVNSRPPDPAGVWESPHTVLSSLTERFHDCDEMYFHNPARDAALAARLIIASAGHRHAKPGDALDEESCLQRGQAAMGRTLESYAGWMSRIVKSDGLFRSCVFSVHEGRRIGASVVLPLVEDAYRRLITGEIRDDGFHPDALSSRSRCIFVAAMSHPVWAEGITPFEKSVAQARSVVYQIAYFTRRLKPNRPTLMTVMTTPSMRGLLARMGFVASHRTLCGTPHPFAIFKRPAQIEVQTWISYHLLVTTLNVFRIANRRLWSEEDRMRRHAGDMQL